MAICNIVFLRRLAPADSCADDDGHRARVDARKPVGDPSLTRASIIYSNTLFSTELAAVKDYSRRFQKQMDKTTEIGVYM